MNEDVIRKIFDDEPEEVDNIITIVDESGAELDFEFLDLIEYQGEDYVVLLPVDDSDEAGEVVILRLITDDEDLIEEYEGVEDDRIVDAVFNIFKEKFADEFNFID